MSRTVCLIQVPFHAGDDRHGSSEGPGRVINAGAADVFRQRGIPVEVELVDRGAPFRDTASSAREVNKALAAIVRTEVGKGALPIILTGSCNSALGVLAGFDHASTGLVWIDAHADFNTPESSISGSFPGMSLAVVTGHCYRDYWAQIGDNTPVHEGNVVLVGVRDLSPDAERERLQQSRITVIGWRDGKPQSDVEAAIQRLAGRAKQLYLHIDFDGFDPDLAPGVVDEPVPGGLSFDDAKFIICLAAESLSIQAVTLATYTPQRDPNGRTLALALEIIELIADHLSEATGP